MCRHKYGTSSSRSAYTARSITKRYVVSSRGFLAAASSSFPMLSIVCFTPKREVKSLAPDGTPCTGKTRGLLLRAKITAGKLVPVGKETDRRWEQGEDPSMIDPNTLVFEKRTKLVIADPSERKRWSDIGLRRIMGASKLSQEPVSNALKGIGVRPQTLSMIPQAAARLSTKVE